MMDGGDHTAALMMSSLGDSGLVRSAELWGWFITSERGSGRTAGFEVWEQLGDALKAQDQLLSAVEKYKKALAMCLGGITGEASARLRKKIAKCFIASGNKKQAMKMLESIRGGDCDVEAEFLLGRVYLDAGITKAAHVCFKNVLKRSPMALEAAELLAESGGSFDEDIWGLIDAEAKAVGMPVRALDVFKAYLKGLTLLSKGSVQDACEVFSEAEKNTINCAPLSICLAESEYELYVSFSDLESAERSEDAFSKAKTADPWIVRSMDDYSSLLLETGRLSTLTDVCGSLLEVDPLSPVAWRSAAILCKLHNYRERAAKLDGQLQHVCERAARKLRNPLSVRPSQQISLAEIQLRSGSFSEAHATAKDAIRRAPKSAVAYCIYAKIMISLERAKKATAAFEKAVKLAPDCVDASIGLARGYEERGDLSKCLSALEDYIQKFKDYGSVGHRAGVTSARVELANILIDNNRWSDAAKQIKEALVVDPDNELVRKAADKLELAMRDAADNSLDDSGRLGSRGRGRTLNFDSELDLQDDQIEHTDF